MQHRGLGPGAVLSARKAKPELGKGVGDVHNAQGEAPSLGCSPAAPSLCHSAQLHPTHGSSVPVVFQQGEFMSSSMYTQGGRFPWQPF